MTEFTKLEDLKTDEPVDCIVIGGGLAGLTAARDLQEKGKSSILLEARDRVGGRTFSRNFTGSDQQIDMGGQFLGLAYQPGIRGEIERYGVEVELPEPAPSIAWITGGERREGVLPIPIEEVQDLERAIFAIYDAAKRIDPDVPLDRQDLADLDVSWSSFIEPLNLPATTADFLSLIPGYYGLRDPDSASALFLLQQFAVARFSPSEYLFGAHPRSTVGMKGLTDAMAPECGPIVLEAPVAEVSRADGGVTVITKSGTRLRARTALLAIPLNCWTDVRFDPPISAAKLEASAQGQASNTGTKTWVLATDSEADVITGFDSAPGVLGLLQQYELPNGQLKILWTNAEVDDGGDGVQRALEAISPGSKLVAFDYHDWNGDEYSKGTWCCPVPGMLSKSHSELARSEDNLFFAGSDVSVSLMAWMGGAVDTGHQAAEDVISALS